MEEIFTIGYKSGKVVRWEHQRYIRAFGTCITTYELNDCSEFLKSFYGDHLCSQDTFNKKIPPSQVPRDVRTILGGSIENCVEQFKDSKCAYNFIEIR